ncbi:hypothetical protein CPC08DRAFT_317797 [Agrocybe pediades]|nr:hypothetical protein CPC08DRAFT_317797 [Agrocybe pediades]
MPKHLHSTVAKLHDAIVASSLTNSDPMQLVRSHITLEPGLHSATSARPTHLSRPSALQLQPSLPHLFLYHRYLASDSSNDNYKLIDMF